MTFMYISGHVDGEYGERVSRTRVGQRQLGDSSTPLARVFALAPRSFVGIVHVDFSRVSTRDREPVLLYAAPGMSFLD